MALGHSTSSPFARYRVAALTFVIAFAAPAFAQTSGNTIAIKDAIDRALVSAPKVRAAENALDAQVERRRGSWSDLGPRVSVGYNLVQFDKAREIPLGEGKVIPLQPKVSRTADVTVVQPITGAFALVENARLQGVQEDIKELGVRQAKADVAFGAAESYLRALAALRQVEIADESIRAAQKQASDASALERVGRMNRGDTLKLDLAVSEAKARAAQTKAGVEIALAALKETLGLQQSDNLQLDPTLPGVSDAATGSIDDVVRAALARRIDDDEAELGVEAAHFGKKLAYAGFSPSINLFAKQERNLEAEEDKDTRSYGVQLTWDIWQNGSRIFAVRAASSDILQAENGRDALMQGIRIEIAQTLANLNAARESLTLAQTAVEQADEAYRIENARFQTGTRSATDLILAESSRSGAQGRLVTASTDLLVWKLRLQKALGDERPTFASN